MRNEKNSKIFLAGHNGLVGSAILQKLKKKKFKKIIVVNKKELDLRDQKKVLTFFKKKKPTHVIIAAAKVGGIKANNKYGAEFIYDNLQIQNNIIHAAYLNKVKSLVFLGSSCIYPKFSKQPIKEKYLLSSELEKTNEAYAIAKIAGVKLCEYYNYQYKTNFLSLMPCNTFGPNDNYDLSSSHFLPALIRKIYEAKIKRKNFIELWGNGKTKREVIYVEDLADSAIYFLFKNKTLVKDKIINVGTQKEFTILQYAKMIMRTFNVKLNIKFVNTKLIGTPRKVLDCTLAKNLGWRYRISIKHGIQKTVNDFVKNYKKYS